MLTAFDEMIHGRAVAGVAAAVAAVELAVLVPAARRRRRGPLPLKVHAIAGAAIAPLAVAIGLSAHAARSMAMRAIAGADNPMGNAVGLITGITGQLNATAFGVATLILAATLWLAGTAFTLGAPRAAGRARALPPVALVALGLLPIAYGALEWSTEVIVPFNALDDIPGEQRSAVIARTLDVARAHFEAAARLSMLAIPVLAAVAIALIVWRDRRRDADASARGRRPWRAPAALAAGFVVLAGVLVVEARPMAQENARPWPPPAGGDRRLPAIDPPTPDLRGPDAIESGPVVQVHPDRLGLDGAAVADLDTLYDHLDLLRVNYPRMHHGWFNDTAMIVADPRVPMSRLHAVLQAALKAEYHKPLFVFTNAEVIVRPVLGRLERINATAARVRLAYADGKNDRGDGDEDTDDDDAALWKDAVPLRLQDFAVYEPFARRLVDLRRAGKRVIVRIDRPAR